MLIKTLKQHKANKDFNNALFSCYYYAIEHFFNGKSKVLYFKNRFIGADGKKYRIYTKIVREGAKNVPEPPKNDKNWEKLGENDTSRAKNTKNKGYKAKKDGREYYGK